MRRRAGGFPRKRCQRDSCTNCSARGSLLSLIHILEMDVEKPSESGIFKNFPEFLADHHARDFVCDTLRMAITGGVEPFDMDQMMELDMEDVYKRQPPM